MSAVPKSLRLGLMVSMLACAVLSAAAPQQKPLAQLRVSDNKRFLVTSAGRPFFWLGDTAWELFHRLTREDAERYLQQRAKLGFTVIQAVVLAEFDGLGTPNAYGHTPLADADPDRPNERYFAHVDWIVARANALGMYVGMLPTWGDKWNRGKQGVGPEIFTPTNAERYGEWLGRRYKDAGVICGMARGVRAGDGGRHLITFHPPGGQTSSTWFHDEPWLDFNMRQNGHGTEFTGRYEQTRADYDRSPTKPVLDGEPIYEDHPIAFDAKRFGHSMGADVRRALYWDLFSGAFGHTYGHHSVWQFFAPGRTPVNNPLLDWTQAIEQAGAQQMRHGRALIESRPFLTRIPADDVIVAGPVATSLPGAGRYRFVATRDTDRTFAMVYVPAGRPFSVRMDVIAGAKVKAWWFDPRSGRAVDAGTYGNSGDKAFTPPEAGELLDWVLVLDDAARNYPPPGGRGFRL
jgi:hypothetical protein